jgi:membrane fusion protein, multidrug efflux system
MNRRLIALFSLTVTLSLCFGLGCAKQDPSASTGAPTTTTSAVTVQTTEVGEAAFPKTLPLTGSLRGEAEADLAAGTNGRLVKVAFDRGTKVKKGDVLAVVDTRQAQISAAEAAVGADLAKEQVANADRECARTKALYDRGALAKAEYERLTDQCRTSSLNARAAGLRAAQAGQTVYDGTIRAPFDGTIADRWIDVGEFVRADSRVATLVNPSALKLEFSAPERLLGTIKNGDSVAFRVQSQPLQSFRATIMRTGIAVRESTRDLPFEARVDHSDLLLPGMFAEVHVTIGTETTPCVSPKAIVQKDGKTYAWVVEQGRANLRVVSVGITQDGLISVPRGLHKGDRVVLDPQPSITNGAPVGVL